MNSTGTERREFPLWLFILQIICIIACIRVIPIPMWLYDALPFLHYYYLFPLINGISFYMVYRGGYARLFGIVGLIAFAFFLFYVTARTGTVASFHMPRAAAVWATVIGLVSGLIRAMLSPSIVPILMIVIAIAADRRRNNGPSFTAFVSLAAIANMIVLGLFYWMIGGFSALMSVSAGGSILLALAIIPSVLLVKAIDERQGWERFSPPEWARLWYGLALLATVMILIVPIDGRSGIKLTLGLPAAIGLFMLLLGQRSAFHLYAIGTIACVHAFPISLSYKQPLMTWGLLCAIVLIFITTWALTRHASFKSAEKPQQEPRRMHWIVPAIETISILPYLLFLAPSGGREYMDVRSMSFMFLTVATALVILQGTAAILGFQKRGSIVLHAFCLSVAAITYLCIIWFIIGFAIMITMR